MHPFATHKVMPPNAIWGLKQCDNKQNSWAVYFAAIEQYMNKNYSLTTGNILATER